MLATEIDDVVDYLEEASDLLGLYGVEMPTRTRSSSAGSSSAPASSSRSPATT